MKWTRFLAMILTFSLILPGCEEVENPDVLNETTTLVEHVDLSAVSAPEEVSVYSAVLWEQQPEKITDIFLGSDFTEEKAGATGRRFVKNAGTKREERVIVSDGGRTFFGDDGHSEENGIIYTRNDYSKICENSDGFEEMTTEYISGSGKISDNVPDENDEAFLAAKERTSQYLEQLGMEGYALDAAAVLATKKQKNKKSYWMCWKQLVDGIPISDTAVRHDEKEVYNFRQVIASDELIFFDSSLEVMYMGNELADWGNFYIIHADKVLKKSPLVPVEQAYQKVKECYPLEKTGTHILERAELQYELIELKEQAGKYYLYPVWVFTVYEETANVSEHEKWIYYLMDAFTGDFFSELPAELLQ